MGTWRDIDSIPDPLKQALFDYTDSLCYADDATDPMKRKISELDIVLRRSKSTGGEGSNYGNTVQLVWCMIKELHKIKATNLHGIWPEKMEVDNKKHMAFTLAGALAHYNERVNVSHKRSSGIEIDSKPSSSSKKSKNT